MPAGVPWLLERTPGGELAALLERPAWMADALCQEPRYRRVSFIPTRGDDVPAAKRICARCLVRQECYTFGVATRSVGIWGGESLPLGRPARRTPKTPT